MAAISLRGDFDEPMLWALVLGEKTGERLQTPALSRDDSWRLVRGSGEEYLLRTNLTNQDPAVLWQYYVQLVWFKNLKGDLAIRQIFHKDERRIEAHIFVDFHLLEFRCRLAGLRGARQECPPRRSRRRHLVRWPPAQQNPASPMSPSPRPPRPRHWNCSAVVRIPTRPRARPTSPRLSTSIRCGKLSK